MAVDLSGGDGAIAAGLEQVGVRVVSARAEREAVERILDGSLQAVVVTAICPLDGPDRRGELRLRASRLAHRIRADHFDLPILCILDDAAADDADCAFVVLPATTSVDEIASRLLDILGPCPIACREQGSAHLARVQPAAVPRDVDALIRDTRRLLDETRAMIARLR